MNGMGMDLAEMLMEDEGCPNFPADHGDTVRRLHPTVEFKTVAVDATKLHRQHRTIIHLVTIAMISGSLYIGWDTHANWLFVALSLMSEWG